MPGHWAKKDIVVCKSYILITLGTAKCVRGETRWRKIAMELPQIAFTSHQVTILGHWAGLGSAYVWLI